MLLGILTCKEALRRLDDYVDRELSQDEMKKVQFHLRICHACSRKFAFEKSFVGSVREKISHIDIPPDLLADVKSALDAAEER
jgi:hypothetical protein